jgi:hypothetical protein
MVSYSWGKRVLLAEGRERPVHLRVDVSIETIWWLSLSRRRTVIIVVHNVPLPIGIRLAAAESYARCA